MSVYEVHDHGEIISIEADEMENKGAYFRFLKVVKQSDGKGQAMEFIESMLVGTCPISCVVVRKE